MLREFDVESSPFDSVGLNYVLHCLPGDLGSKARVFDHVAEHLSDSGILFGSTLLSAGVGRTWVARRLASYYNRRRIFSNDRDTLDGLRTELEWRFERVEIEVVGGAALFAASIRRENRPFRESRTS